ncbi:unknown [Ruminococcus sp. CAG:330]|nr:unknown [Ruminococcus sp. CAG:330]
MNTSSNKGGKSNGISSQTHFLERRSHSGAERTSSKPRQKAVAGDPVLRGGSAGGQPHPRHGHRRTADDRHVQQRCISPDGTVLTAEYGSRHVPNGHLSPPGNRGSVHQYAAMVHRSHALFHVSSRCCGNPLLPKAGKAQLLHHGTDTPHCPAGIPHRAWRWASAVRDRAGAKFPDRQHPVQRCRISYQRSASPAAHIPRLPDTGRFGGNSLPRVFLRFRIPLDAALGGRSGELHRLFPDAFAQFRHHTAGAAEPLPVRCFHVSVYDTLRQPLGRLRHSLHVEFCTGQPLRATSQRYPVQKQRFRHHTNRRPCSLERRFVRTGGRTLRDCRSGCGHSAAPALPES